MRLCPETLARPRPSSPAHSFALSSILHVISEVAPSSSRGVLSWNILSRIRNVERQLTDSDAWRDFCGHTAVRVLCSPGGSFLSYAFPTVNKDMQNVETGRLQGMKYDKRGRDWVPLRVALATSNKNGQWPMFFPRETLALAEQAGGGTASLRPEFLPSGEISDDDDEEPAVFRRTKTLRSHFVFLTDSGPMNAPMEQQRKFVNQERKLWIQLIEGTVYPQLEAAASQGPLRVFYSGDYINSYEVMSTINGDRLLALCSLALVMTYMVVHTRKPLESVLAVLMIFGAVPIAFVVYAFLAGSGKLSIASFLAFFLVVGLGADVVFVFDDFWKQSGALPSEVGGAGPYYLFVLESGDFRFATL